MAMLVVWSHSFALYKGSESSEPISRLTSGMFNSGNLGVYVFFIVSGFLITQSFQRSRSYWSFLQKRIARIYPGYLTAVCVCAFIIVPIYSPATVYTPSEVIKTIGFNLMLRNYFFESGPFTRNPGSSLNGSLWSIPYEFWCYLGVLALGVFRLLKPSTRTFLLSSFVVTLLIHAWLEVSGRKPGGGMVGVIIGWPYLWFKMLPCFQAGMLVHQYREKLPRAWWLMAGGVLTLIAVSDLPIALNWKSAIVATILPPVVAYAVFYFAFKRQVIDAARYGDFSYGTYLYAFPIQQMIIAQFSTRMPFGVFVVIATILSLGAGIASWYLVEQWFSGASQKRRSKESEFRGKTTVLSTAAIDVIMK
jgi:peptidoglycan/LPS O-acetylase OafA/YrhL